jgi:transposase
MRKQELLSLVAANKQTEKSYRVDSMMAFFGHIFLRLPPHVYDLTPIELAWAKVKTLVRDNNITGELSVQSVTDLTKSLSTSVTKEDWTGYSKHGQMVEQ